MGHKSSNYIKICFIQITTNTIGVLFCLANLGVHGSMVSYKISWYTESYYKGFLLYIGLLIFPYTITHNRISDLAEIIYVIWSIIQPCVDKLPYLTVDLQQDDWQSLDSLWPQRSASTLAQVMDCCLVAPNHYLNQCWLLISSVLRFNDIHLRAISQPMPKLLFCIMSLKIIHLKSRPYLPETWMWATLHQRRHRIEEQKISHYEKNAWGLRESQWSITRLNTN